VYILIVALSNAKVKESEVTPTDKKSETLNEATLNMEKQDATPYSRIKMTVQLTHRIKTDESNKFLGKPFKIILIGFNSSSTLLSSAITLLHL
jgi:hypothetical protein